ncbi:MAG: ATP-grasp domain-containing protein [Phycisphaerales bacterium]
MARLHEYQGKALLQAHGIAIPRGLVARTPSEARKHAETLNTTVMVKAQAWITGRKAKGGIEIARNPEEAEHAAARIMNLTFGSFPVAELLLEEALEIAHELFVSIAIDDAAAQPVVLIDLEGGSGIEERAEAVLRVPVTAFGELDSNPIRSLLKRSPIHPKTHEAIVEAIQQAVATARSSDARSLEINPLAVTTDGKVVAADCRVTIDDYAVFRHPELNIDIARELDHPPTQLERIAYVVEESDHRGTFYFAQLPTDGHEHTKGLIGFHGAGGGGSMMSMDAITNAGFTIANFCDTSGNPSAAKVYRAARIILSQPGLVGYFGSGSGVASQEQFWSAYGLAKAFNELNLNIPAVIRLGGNSEDRAVAILEDACSALPAKVRGFRKDDTPQYCAEQFAKLVQDAGRGRRGAGVTHRRRIPSFISSAHAHSFSINGGSVWIDHANCDAATTKTVLEHSFGLLKKNEQGKPVLAVSAEEAQSKDSELIACEIECLRAGKPVVFVGLQIEGLD